MKRKLLSVLLVLAMALTLLPTAAFAAGETAGTTAPKVAGYGFVWDAEKYKGDSAEKLTGGFNAGSDWMGETMYVAFAENGLAEGTHLWFEVTVGTDPNADVWGCAATASTDKDTGKVKGMFAFSFLNRTTQWEQHPENITVGADQAHAEKYLKEKSTVSEVTLNIYTTTEEFTSTKHDTTGLTPFKTLTVKIDSNKDTMEVVEDKPDATPVSIGITAATQADTTTPPVEGPLSTEYSVATADTTVTVTAKNIKEHKNGANNTGYWIGATFTPKATDTTDTTEYVILYKDSNSKWAIDTDSCTDGSIVSLYIDAFKDGTLNTTGGQITVGVFAKADAFNGDTVKANLDDSAAKLTKTYTVKASTDCTKYTATPSTPELTFSMSVGTTDFFGKTAAQMAKDIEFTKDATKENTYNVTGYAYYIEDYTGWNVASEKEGNYLPIHISTGTDEEASVVLTNRAEGSKNGKTITLPNGQEDVAVWLGGKVGNYSDFAAGALAQNTFTVEYNSVKYTINYSGVVLALKAVEPEVDVNGKATVDATDDTIKNIIASAKENVGTDGATAEDTTVTINANAATTVEVPNALVADMKGGVAATVETQTATVALPSEAVNKMTHDMTITTTDAKTEVAGKTLTFAEGSTATNAEVQAAIQAAVDITVKSNSVETLKTSLNDSVITLTIKVPTTLNGTKVHVVYIADDDKVERMTRDVVTVEGGKVPVEVKHLSTYAVVTEAVGDKIAESNDIVVSPTSENYEVAGAVTGNVGKKVTINGIANNYYVIQGTINKKTAPAVIYVVKADGNGKAEFYVNTPATTIQVWKAGATAPTFANGIPGTMTELHDKNA